MTTIRVRTLPSLVLFGSLVLAACGGDDGGGMGVDAPTGAPSCTVTATATPNVSSRTITGNGVVQCNATATIAIETCVQWNPNGTFADIMCVTSTMSGVMQHQLENLSSCGIATGRMYRTRVNAIVNGTAQNEVLSTTVSCQ